MSENKITAFVDNVGRVIVGEVISSDDTTIKIKEPAVVNVQIQQESGQISVQLLPFVFREFVTKESREQGVEWTFNKNNLVVSDNLDLDNGIINQYNSIFKPKPVEQAAPEVVKLFDDEN